MYWARFTVPWIYNPSLCNPKIQWIQGRDLFYAQNVFVIFLLKLCHPNFHSAFKHVETYLKQRLSSDLLELWPLNFDLEQKSSCPMQNPQITLWRWWCQLLLCYCPYIVFYITVFIHINGDHNSPCIKGLTLIQDQHPCCLNNIGKWKPKTDPS